MGLWVDLVPLPTMDALDALCQWTGPCSLGVRCKRTKCHQVIPLGCCLNLPGIIVGSGSHFSVCVCVSLCIYSSLFEKYRSFKDLAHINRQTLGAVPIMSEALPTEKHVNSQQAHEDLQRDLARTGSHCCKPCFLTVVPVGQSDHQ